MVCAPKEKERARAPKEKERARAKRKREGAKRGKEPAHAKKVKGRGRERTKGGTESAQERASETIAGSDILEDSPASFAIVPSRTA